MASTIVIAEMSERAQITSEQVVALTAIAHDSGALRGRRSIGGGRQLLRDVMFHDRSRRKQPQPPLATLCRPFAERRKTSQDLLRYRPPKTRLYRKRFLQIPSETGRHAIREIRLLDGRHWGLPYGVFRKCHAGSIGVRYSNVCVRLNRKSDPQVTDRAARRLVHSRASNSALTQAAKSSPRRSKLSY